jgi:chorismate mutase
MSLKELREEIDAINMQLIALFGKRLKIAKKIAEVKREAKLPILDKEREKEEILLIRNVALACGIKPEVIEKIFGIYIEYTRDEMKQ